MIGSRGTITVFISCLASAVLMPVACQVDPTGDGGWRVTPAQSDPPGSGGIYREVIINGRCFMSNGTWCIPCKGGEARPCREILQQPATDFIPAGGENDSVGAPADIVDDAGSGGWTEYEDQFFAMTGGLDAQTFQILAGWDLWEQGDEVEGPFILNLYTDEGHVDADGRLHRQWVDVSFLWRADWAQPAADDLPPAVRLGAYVNGNLADDDPADLMLLRVSGPAAQVKAVLGPLAVPGTEFEVTLPDGFTWQLP